MGRHRIRWLCPVCGRRRVPTKNRICYACERIEPRLPPIEGPKTVRPAAKRGAVG